MMFSRNIKPRRELQFALQTDTADRRSWPGTYRQILPQPDRLLSGSSLPQARPKHFLAQRRSATRPTSLWFPGRTLLLRRLL